MTTLLTVSSKLKAAHEASPPVKSQPGETPQRGAKREPLPPGVGTEFKKIADTLRLPTCGRCWDLCRKMNNAGIDWCEEHAAELVAELNENRRLLGVLTQAKAAALAVKHGLPLTLSGLLQEAIRRADSAQEPR